MITLENIKSAASRMAHYGDSVLIRAPTVYCKTSSELLQSRLGRDIAVHFKCEHLQPVGSFKVRGALNFALSLSPEVRKRGLITHSSGNHGIAVAAVGQLLGVSVVVVVPRDTSKAKIDRISSHGAEVVLCEPGLESREATTSNIANDRHMNVVPPFDHEWTMTGQGTMGLEIMEDVPDVDVVVAAVGGCGMISGLITAVKGLNPAIRVYGAEPSGADDTWASLRAGRRVGPTHPGSTTICDALRVSPPGKLCWEIVSKEVDGVFLVPDDRTVCAMKHLANTLKQITEPSGACATGLLFSDEFIDVLKSDESVTKIVFVICGGNIDLNHFMEIIR